MEILSVEKILGADDAPQAEVDVPEWGGQVVVQALRKGKQLEMRRHCTNPDGTMDGERLELMMFVYGVVEPTFTVEQAELLKDKAAGPIDRINRVILELSGLTQEAMKAADKSFHIRR